MILFALPYHLGSSGANFAKNLLRLALVYSQIVQLGWDPKPGESHLDAMLIGEDLIALVVSGHDLMLDEASRCFQVFLEDRSTQLCLPDIRKATYVIVMQRAGKSNHFVMNG
ncbi:hypothetical protein K1719_040101 [Acacia pycnantha]|nr:hypothetical protein K1719_040101 [Acacia pycnantha]